MSTVILFLHCSYPLQISIMKVILYLSYNTVLRIWKSGPLLYQLTHSIYNLKNIKLSVQTEGHTYTQQMCVSDDHKKMY